MLLAISMTPAICRADSAPTPIEDRARAIQCLSLAVAYEAANESDEGKAAVAEVILNRVRHPAFPKSICDVVFAGSKRRTGCQFSFTCDGSMRRRLSDRTMSIARAIAQRAMDGDAPSYVAGATHYHASYVNPYWAPSLLRLTRIGLHIFYTMSPHGQAPGTERRIMASARKVPVASVGNGGSASPRPRPFAPWGLMPSATGKLDSPIASPAP